MTTITKLEFARRAIFEARASGRATGRGREVYFLIPWGALLVDNGRPVATLCAPPIDQTAIDELVRRDGSDWAVPIIPITDGGLIGQIVSSAERWLSGGSLEAEHGRGFLTYAGSQEEARQYDRESVGRVNN